VASSWFYTLQFWEGLDRDKYFQKSLEMSILGKVWTQMSSSGEV